MDSVGVMGCKRDTPTPPFQAIRQSDSRRESRLYVMQCAAYKLDLTHLRLFLYSTLTHKTYPPDLFC